MSSGRGKWLVVAVGVLLGGDGAWAVEPDLLRAVSQLRKGAVVRAIEKASERGASTPLSLPAFAAVTAAIDVSDACSGEASPSLGELMACFRELLQPGLRKDAFLAYFRYFSPAMELPASAMGDREIREFLDVRRPKEAHWMDVRLGLEPPFGGDRLRSSFSNSELRELVLLIDSRIGDFARAESLIRQSVLNHRAMFERLASELKRYRVLLAIVDTYGDHQGKRTAELIDRALGVEESHSLPQEFWPLLHPYALGAVIPAEGDEFLELDSLRENPFAAVRKAAVDLGGSAGRAGEFITSYSYWRNRDNPRLPPAPAESSVSVAFIDSGLDFEAFPELGLFLGPSHDFSDDDSNPWLPAIRRDFAHGSGTAATLLTVVSRQRPELLLERKVDLRFWKTHALRQLLAGAHRDFIFWESHRGLQNAMRYAGLNPEKAPRIISVSMSVLLSGILERSDRGVIARVPSLWVMAAGNSGVETSRDKSGVCFEDLPMAWRRDSRVLCVGALSRRLGPGGRERIARYSNYGERVDVYAYESYVGTCPSGTSCATPAISAAAVILASEFPGLSSEQLKHVIVEAAEERELEVEAGEATPVVEVRRVRVFDPETMMDAAREVARGL